MEVRLGDAITRRHRHLDPAVARVLEHRSRGRRTLEVTLRAPRGRWVDAPADVRYPWTFAIEEPGATWYGADAVISAPLVARLAAVRASLRLRILAVGDVGPDLEPGGSMGTNVELAGGRRNVERVVRHFPYATVHPLARPTRGRIPVGGRGSHASDVAAGLALLEAVPAVDRALLPAVRASMNRASPRRRPGRLSSTPSPPRSSRGWRRSGSRSTRPCTRRSRSCLGSPTRC